MSAASAAQVAMCRALFRKSKLHYSMCGDAKLRDEVLRRTGYDLDDLTHDEVVAISTHLNAVLGKRRRFNCSDVADGGGEVKD